MNEVEEKILRKFKSESSKDISTSDLVQEVLPKEYHRVKEILLGVSEHAQLGVAKRRKGQLHRRILYYLNKLSKKETIIQTRVVGRGEKYFTLNVQKFSPNKQGFESQSFQPMTPIEGGEQEGLVRKWDKESWSSRVNSILVDASKFSGIFKLQASISDMFSELNDGIGIYGFEELIGQGDTDVIGEGLRRLDLEAKDFNRGVCLLVNLKKTLHEDKWKQFIELWVHLKPERLKVIWELDADWMERHAETFSVLLGKWGEARLSFYVNNTGGKAPCFLGQSGTYRMSEEEWKKFLGMKVGLVGICSITIEVQRFFSGGRSYHEFRSLVKKAAKALFYGHWTLREQGSERFTSLNQLNNSTRSFYQLGANQLRFEGFPSTGKEASHFLSLLESCQAEVQGFVKVQETILKSCGMPVRFQIALGSSGKGETPMIMRTADFFKPEIQEFLRIKERLAQITEGREVLEWKTLNSSKEEWMNQLRYILDHVRVPFLCLSFGEERGVVKLTSFMG